MFPSGKTRKENQKENLEVIAEVFLTKPCTDSSQFWIYGSAVSKGLRIIKVITFLMSGKTKNTSVLFCKNGVVSTLFQFQIG